MNALGYALWGLTLVPLTPEPAAMRPLGPDPIELRPASPPASPPASAGGMLLKAVGRHLARETGQEASEQVVKKLAQEVSDATVQRTAKKVLQQGGEASLTAASDLVARHGGDVLRALDNVPHTPPVLKALRQLPAAEVSPAAARLAAGPSGRELATLCQQLGPVVLRAEAKHPGIGIAFVRALGTEGAELSLRLTTTQAQQLGKHLDDLARLPAGQRGALLELIRRNADRFVQFSGRFVEQHPGKVLFTTASTAIILGNSDAIFGDGDYLFDADGQLIITPSGTPLRRHPGIVPQGLGSVQTIITAPVQTTLYLLGGILVLLLGVKALRILRHPARK